MGDNKKTITIKREEDKIVCTMKENSSVLKIVENNLSAKEIFDFLDYTLGTTYVYDTIDEKDNVLVEVRNLFKGITEGIEEALSGYKTTDKEFNDKVNDSLKDINVNFNGENKTELKNL